MTGTLKPKQPVIKSLSYSKINSLLTCPRNFRYQYIDRLPQPHSGTLLAGNVYHNTLAFAETRKMTINELITKEEIKETISRFWDKGKQDEIVYDGFGGKELKAKIIDWGDNDEGELKDKVTELANMYCSEVLPKLHITGVEERQRMSIDGIPFTGYIDLRLDDGYKIVDHKFTRNKMNQSKADSDLQISAYATLLNHPVTGEFHQALTATKKQIWIVETSRDNDDIAWFKELAKEAWEVIQNGVFPPNPQSWKCSPNYCPFYTICRYPNF